LFLKVLPGKFGAGVIELNSQLANRQKMSDSKIKNHQPEDAAGYICVEYLEGNIVDKAVNTEKRPGDRYGCGSGVKRIHDQNFAFIICFGFAGFWLTHTITPFQLCIITETAALTINKKSAYPACKTGKRLCSQFITTILNYASNIP
jgi:hypothetical protein